MSIYGSQFNHTVRLCAADPMSSGSSCKTSVRHHTADVVGAAAATSVHTDMENLWGTIVRVR